MNADGNNRTDGDRVANSVARLFSMAGIAGGLALRSYPVRCFLLWVLWRAELAASRLVYGTDEFAEPPLASLIADAMLIAFAPQDCAAEAERLANSLRWLAGELRRQQQQEEKLRQNTGREPQAPDIERLFDLSGLPDWPIDAEMANVRACGVPQPVSPAGQTAARTRWRHPATGFT